MTADDLMRLISRYVEACDDLGDGLFEKPLTTTDTLHAKATALHGQILSEVERLHAEALKSERRAVAFGDIVHTQTLAMRAAVVDGVLSGPEAGMAWILNTLEGPGHLPDVNAAKAEGGAQAMFNRELAEHETFRAAHPAP